MRSWCLPVLVVDKKRIDAIHQMDMHGDVGVPVDTAPYRTLGDPIIPVGGGLDVTQLPIGSYQLQARARDSIAQSTAWSSVALGIQ